MKPHPRDDAILGFALLEVDWDTVLTVPLERPYRPRRNWKIGTWRIDSVRIDTEPCGRWGAWKSNVETPVWIDQVALLREDMTPFDARPLADPILIPEGHYITNVAGHLTIEEVLA